MMGRHASPEPWNRVRPNRPGNDAAGFAARRDPHLARRDLPADRRFVGDWVLKSGYVHDYQAIRILDDGTFETYALPSDLLAGLRDQKLLCYTRGGYLSIRTPIAKPNSINELWRIIKAAIAGERHPSDTHYQIIEIDSASFLIRNNDTVLPFRRVAAAN